MKQKTAVKISIILLVGIAFAYLFKIYDLGSYLVSRHEDEKEMTEIYKNADVQHLKFRNLDRINSFLSKNELNNAATLLDSLILNDSSRIDLYLKRGFVNYKLNRKQKAETDFKFIIEKTTVHIGGQTIVKDNVEQHYYALIGFMLAEGTIDEPALKEYNGIKKKSYINASFDSINKTITFNVDSAITKQIYDWE